MSMNSQFASEMLNGAMGSVNASMSGFVSQARAERARAYHRNVLEAQKRQAEQNALAMKMLSEQEKQQGLIFNQASQDLAENIPQGYCILEAPNAQGMAPVIYVQEALDKLLDYIHNVQSRSQITTSDGRTGHPTKSKAVSIETLLKYHPMHIAAKHNKLEFLQHSVKKGLPLNNIDEQGNTPLHFAAKAGHKDVIDFLVGHRLSLFRSNFEGHSPLDLLKTQRNIAILEDYEDLETAVQQDRKIIIEKVGVQGNPQGALEWVNKTLSELEDNIIDRHRKEALIEQKQGIALYLQTHEDSQQRDSELNSKKSMTPLRSGKASEKARLE